MKQIDVLEFFLLIAILCSVTTITVSLMSLKDSINNQEKISDEQVVKFVKWTITDYWKHEN